MNCNESIDTKLMIEEVLVSKDKETYRLLEKTLWYRIGIGVRNEMPAPPSFFVEVIVNFSRENGEVNLPRLERIVLSLKTLQEEGYKLTYQGDNCISCEKTISTLEVLQEYARAKSVITSVCEGS